MNKAVQTLATRGVDDLMQDAIGYGADAIRECVTSMRSTRGDLLDGDLEKAQIAAERMLKRIKEARTRVRRATRKR